MRVSSFSKNCVLTGRIKAIQATVYMGAKGISLLNYLPPNPIRFIDSAI